MHDTIVGTRILNLFDVAKRAEIRVELPPPLGHLEGEAALNESDY